MIKPVIDIKRLRDLSAAFGTESYLENVRVSGGDYSEIEIDDISLEKVYVDGTVLNQAKIRDLKILDSIFSNCSLAGGVIEFSHFTRLEMKSSRLQGIQLSQARVHDSSFIASKMDGTNLRFAKLKNVLFDSCDLRGADFIGTELQHVVFKNCNLTESNFSQSKLVNVDIAGSNIENIVIDSNAIQEVFVDTGQAIYLSSIFGLKIRD